ncbi:DUF4956 domain-containing protein [Candidatus Margulisiibacteriota bacterium]
MGKYDLIKKYLLTYTEKVFIPEFVVNIILAGILTYILGKLYVKYGKALSNRGKFASTFFIITTTTMLIITIVKSSLALSLGLVGALSIVRFRAAIKDPEELTYLFLAIAIGLGFGANQKIITIIGVLFIFAIIWFKNQLFSKEEQSENLLIVISSPGKKNHTIQDVVKIMKQISKSVVMKRVHVEKEVLEASFLIEIKNLEILEKIKKDLFSYNSAMQVTFLENKGI